MPAEASYIDASTVKRLSALDSKRTALALLFDWAVIFGAIAVSQWSQNIAVYILAVVVIGGRMHGFGVLLHEFAHYRFIDGRKTASDWIGDVTLAWPVLTTIAAYRRNHLAHHRYTNTDKDPDWVFKFGNRKFTFPQHWREAAFTGLSYLLVVGSIIDVFSVLGRLKNPDKPPLVYRLARLGYYIFFAALFTLTHSWMGFLLYWVVPYLTVFFLLMHIRSVAEHFGSMDYSDELGSTRTVMPYLWERALFAPHHVNFHLEHHLFPSVPFYNLPQLHAALMANPIYANRAHLTRGYTVGLIRETVGSKPAASAAYPHP